jgi:hypothetical protein
MLHLENLFREGNKKAMVRIIKKRTLFLISIFFTGLVSILGGYWRSSRAHSLIVPSAKADAPAGQSCGWCGCPWTESQCNVYYTCFPAGTHISTPLGRREIQSLVSGDLVYGFDVETGKVDSYPIIKALKHGKDDVDSVNSPLIVLTYEGGGTLTLTENHWVYRKNGRMGDYANFDRAGMLEVGDSLVLEDGREVKIIKIEVGPDYDFVYNLEVEKVHTYFADGIRVHNSGAGGCCDGGGAGGGGAGGGDGK